MLEGTSEGQLVQTLLKQGQPELIAQNLVQMTFEYLQGGRDHNVSGQAVSVLCHPHSESVFPDVQRQSSVFQCMPIASFLSLGITEKSLALSSLQAPSGICIFLFVLLNNLVRYFAC